MFFTGFSLAVAMSTTLVDPGMPVADHSQPTHYTQPTIRRFERKEEDHQRRDAWRAFCQELDGLWQDYRAAGKTPQAFEEYKRAAAQARRRYVIGDPYLAPIVD